MFLFLRILHIITGVFWAGSLFFLVSFLQPALKDAGPGGAPVFAALRARRLFTWTPVLAVITILAGLGVYGMRMGGAANWGATREAQALGMGFILAVIAVIIGIVGMRNPTLAAADMMPSVMALPAGAEKDAAMAKVQALRARAMMSGRLVATLLLLVIILMASARYL